MQKYPPASKIFAWKSKHRCANRIKDYQINIENQQKIYIVLAVGIPDRPQGIRVRYLGDVVHLSELECDAEAAKEDGDVRTRGRERRDLHFPVWGINGRCEIFERFRDLSQRLFSVRH